MIDKLADCDSIVTIVQEKKNRKYAVQGSITTLSCQVA